MLLYALDQDPVFGKLETRLLVSCPANGPGEGGLYLLDFRENSWTKLYAGGCTGMAWVGGRLIVATDDNRLLSFGQDLQLLAASQQDQMDFHGAAAWGDSALLVAETAINAIGCYEAGSFNRLGEIRLNPERKDIHHINDIWLEGNTLYISMFSPYDNWFSDPLQKSGAIIAVSLSGFRPGDSIAVDPADHIAVGNLHMPHSVMMRQHELAYCDSMSFRTVIGQTEIQAGGFTRGLAFADDIVFIGQSRMRHVLRIPHRFSNCCLDGGIYVYHPEFRISRFVPLPEQQVYQILVL
jgi:hypothetical protein